MLVGSVAELLAAFVSPPPDTAAVFVTEAGAFPATFTVSVMAGKLVPDPSASLRVQVRVPNTHVQPVPARAVAVSPDGKVSVMLTSPLDELAPTLLTARLLSAPV